MTPAQVLGTAFVTLHRLARRGVTLALDSHQRTGQSMVDVLMSHGYVIVSAGYDAELNRQLSESRRVIAEMTEKIVELQEATT